MVKSYIDALRRFRKVLSVLKSVNDVSELNKEKVVELIRNLLEGVMILKEVNPPTSLDLTNVAATALDKGVINPELYADITELNVIINASRNIHSVGRVKYLSRKIIEKLLKLASETDPYVTLDADIFRY